MFINFFLYFMRIIENIQVKNIEIFEVSCELNLEQCISATTSLNSVLCYVRFISRNKNIKK